MQVQEHAAVRIDIPFTVPFVHRLRFTRDLLGCEPHVLTEVLEPSGPQPARVQLWIDGRVAAARPDLAGRLCDLVDAHPERLRRTGDVVIVPGGEAIKNDIQLLESMLKRFEEADLDRRSYVVVVG